MERHDRLDEALYNDFESEDQRKRRLAKEAKQQDQLAKLATKKGDNSTEVQAKRKEMDAAKKGAGQQRGNLFYKVTVKDNGSGMPHKDIPNMLGKVLSGTKYGVKQVSKGGLFALVPIFITVGQR